MRKVERGLTHQLLSVGADPGGLANPLRGKNPLSPHWTTTVLAEDPYQLSNRSAKACAGLTALAEHVPLDISDEWLRRTSAQIILPDVSLADGQRATSNAFFTALQLHAFKIVEPHKRNDTKDEFAEEVLSHAYRIANICDANVRGVEHVARSVSKYAWDKFDPQRRQATRPGRGRCSEEVQGKELRERQAIGGRDTRRRQREDSIAQLADAYRELVKSGTVLAGTMPTDAVLATAARKSTKTVQRCRPELQAFIQAEADRQCIYKKLTAHRAITTDEPALVVPLSFLPSLAAGKGQDKAPRQKPIHTAKLPQEEPRPQNTDATSQIRPDIKAGRKLCKTSPISSNEQYLTPEYAAAPVLPGINAAKLRRDLLITNTGDERAVAVLARFRSLAATFLTANPGLTHVTVTADEVRHAGKLPEESPTAYTRLHYADLVLLHLPSDERVLHANGEKIDYLEPLFKLLGDRRINRLPTWVYTPWSTADAAFERRYGHLAQLLAWDFMEPDKALARPEPCQASARPVGYGEPSAPLFKYRTLTGMSDE